MKLLNFIVVLSLLITFSCDDDDDCDNGPVVMDLVVDMFTNPDNNSQLQCLPIEYRDVHFAAGGWMGGETNLNEEILLEDSYFSNYDCVFGPGEAQVTHQSSGKIVFESGDLYYWESEATLTLALILHLLEM